MPITSKVSNYVMNHKASQNIVNVMSELGKQQNAINGNGLIPTFREVAKHSGVSEMLSNKTRYYILEERQSSLRMISSELEAMEQSLRNVLSIIDDSKKWLSVASNALNGGVLDVDNLSNNSLGALQNELNKSFNGAFLYSGNATQNTPVKDLQGTTTRNPDGSFSSKYYQGSIDYKRYIVADSIKLEIPISAVNPEFKNIIGALNTAKHNYHHDKNNLSVYIEAMGHLEESHKTISDYLTFIGTNMNMLQEQERKDSNEMILLQKAITESISEEQTDLMIAFSELHSKLASSLKLVSVLQDPSMQIVTYI